MPTEGMKPTITPNDMSVANPFAYSFVDIKRFDLVVFRPNEEQRKRFNDESVRYLQRVVGLPNEEFEMRDNKIFINDQLLEEPFERIADQNDPKKDFPPFIIPGDEYFLLGDNRSSSEDSRHWKEPTINKKNIYSKIIDVKKDFYGTPGWYGN